MKVQSCQGSPRSSNPHTKIISPDSYISAVFFLWSISCVYSAQEEASGLNQKSVHMPLCQIEVNCMRTPHALSQCNKAVKKGKESYDSRAGTEKSWTRVVSSCPGVQHSCTLSFSSLAWKLNLPPISLSILAQVERKRLFISCWNIYSPRGFDSKPGKHFHIFQSTIKMKGLENTFWCGQYGLLGST